MRSLVVVALLVLGVGCSRQDSPTYGDGVAPLLARRCTRCHSGDRNGVEPPLHTAEQAARAAWSIARAVELRAMPPWGADNTGHCGTFRHASWLSADEISTLSRWARAGAPVGATERARESVRPPPRPDEDGRIIFESTASFSPGLGAKASRCFVVPAPPHDIVATSISGDPDQGLVQSLFALEDDQALLRAQALERAEPTPGFACAADGPERSRLLLSWSFITPVVELPATAGLAIPGGRALVLQARADLAALGLSTEVRPRLSLGVGAGQAAELVSVRAGPSPSAPAQKRAEVSVVWRAPRGMKLLGVVPRIGSHARILEVTIEGAAGQTCAAYFGHWRPSLEQLYLRDSPLELSRGDRVRLTCTMSTLGKKGAADDDSDDRASMCGGALLLSAAP